MERLITKKLLHWKNKKNHKPLIIRGARQVGKTYVITEFAKRYFHDYVAVNLDKKDVLTFYDNAVSVEDFIYKTQIFFDKNIDENTLIFIDEIQNSPNLINLLRFFKEEYPNLYVIAAGSLLEARIKKDSLKIPVGRIEYLYMHPLNFVEFLNAINQSRLVDEINKADLDNNLANIHDFLINKFKDYLLVGGMPEILALYRENKDLTKIKPIIKNLQNSYVDDVSKYSTIANQDDISELIDTLPQYAGKTFKYEEIANDTGISIYTIKKIIWLLDNIMLIDLVYATTSMQIPLNLNPKMPKKLVFLDVGFVNSTADNYLEYAQPDKLESIFKGRIGEQITGQLLLSESYLEKPKFKYWKRNKAISEAELDLTLTYKGRMVGIEVKNSTHGKLKSLFSFAQKVEKPILVRVYSGELRYDTVKYINENYKILSIPFYMLHRLYHFLDLIIEDKLIAGK